MSAGVTRLDFDRCGVPLVEVVTEPVIRSPEEASAFLVELTRVVRALDVCDGNMELGNIRCDANVSIRARTDAFSSAPPLGARTEVKNLNSFAHLRKALAFEIARQISVLQAGGEVVQETRLWDDAAGETRVMRSKEESPDYRYFPEPDIPPLVVPQAMLDEAEAFSSELPSERRRRYRDELSLDEHDADVLASERALGDYFEAVLRSGVRPKTAASWVRGPLLAKIRAARCAIEDAPVGPEALGTILARLEALAITGTQAKEALAKAWEGGDVGAALAEVGEQVTGEDEIAAAVRQVLVEHPDEVAKYRAGKLAVLGFFVGEVMRATAGRASPRRVRDVIGRELAGRSCS